MIRGLGCLCLDRAIWYGRWICSIFDLAPPAPPPPPAGGAPAAPPRADPRPPANPRGPGLPRPPAPARPRPARTPSWTAPAVGQRPASVRPALRGPCLIGMVGWLVQTWLGCTAVLCAIEGLRMTTGSSSFVKEMEIF